MRTVYSRHPLSLWVQALRPGETNRCYWVRGACERTIETAADAAAMLYEAVKQRHTASHALNEASSRSHAIFSLQLIDRQTGLTVTTGSVDSFTAFSATGTPVATQAAERDAEVRLITILADQLVTRLVATVPDAAQ